MTEGIPGSRVAFIPDYDYEDELKMEKEAVNYDLQEHRFRCYFSNAFISSGNRGFKVYLKYHLIHCWVFIFNMILKLIIDNDDSRCYNIDR